MSSKAGAPGDGRGAASPLWLLGLGGLLCVVAFRDMLVFESAQSTSRQLEDWFFEASNTSPLVVLVLSGWLMYRRWGRLTQLPGREELANSTGWAGLALGLLALGAGVLGWATLTGASDISAVAFLLVGLGLATLWKGPSALRAVWLPGLLLLFAVPLPAVLLNVVVYDFQLWTGQWAGWLLHLIGSPALVSGDLIIRPMTNFSIIEGCSGTRSVETLSMLSILLVDLLERRGLHAVLLVVAAPLMAFAMNGLRVLTLIFNPHSEIAAIHNLQGVAVLLCGLAGLLALDVLIERVTSGGKALPRSTEAKEPTTKASHTGITTRSAAIGVWALAGCAVISFAVPRYSGLPTPGLGLIRLLADGIGDWQGSRLETDREFLGSVWFRENLHARYRLGSDAVDVFLGLGGRGRRGTTFLSPKTGLPGSGWEVLDRGGFETPGDRVAGEWKLLRTKTRRVLVYHWYQDTAGLGDEALRSLLALDSSPLQRSSDGLVVRISTDLRGPGLTDLASARERLEGFTAALREELIPLRTACLEEAFSYSSLSRKTFSSVLDLSQLRNSIKTVTYANYGAGTPLAM